MDDITLKIEKMIKVFEKLLEICENNKVLEKASESFVKDYFDSAASLEIFYKKLQQVGCIDEAQACISTVWKHRGRNLPSDISVFEESCDLLLTAYFHCPSLPLKKLSVAVKEYEHHCGNKRLQDLVSHMLREGISCQILHTLASGSIGMLSTVLVGWRNMFNCGQSSKVRNLVIETLKQNPDFVNIIFQLLMRPESHDDVSLKNLLIECVINEMKMENSKQFCSHVVNSTNVVILTVVAERYPEFLTALLESIKTLASEAELQCTRTDGIVECSWKNLGFPLKLLQQLCKREGLVSEQTMSWILTLQKRPGCSLWEDVAACCGV